MPRISCATSWLDNVANVANTKGAPDAVGGRKKQFTFDAGVVIFLFNINTTDDIFAYKGIRVFQGYGTQPVKVTGGRTKHLVGLSAGLNYYRKAFQLNPDDESEDKKFSYKSLDGTIDLPLMHSYPGQGIEPKGNTFTPFSMSHAMRFYGGVYYRTVKNTVILEETNGKMRNNRILDLYLAMFYAPNAAISNVKDTSNTEWRLVPQSETFSHTGYKLGAISSISEKTGPSYGFEMGKRPGVMGNNDAVNYFTIYAGIWLRSKKHICSPKAEYKPLPPVKPTPPKEKEKKEKDDII